MRKCGRLAGRQDRRDAERGPVPGAELGGQFEDYLRDRPREPQGHPHGVPARVRHNPLRTGRPSTSTTRSGSSATTWDEKFGGGRHLRPRRAADEAGQRLQGAAQGYGTERRVLLLHGPVGSSKSTIARRTPGQQQFFSYATGAGTAAAPNVVADGEHWRVSPQFYYYWGPLASSAEYVISDQQRPAGCRDLELPGSRTRPGRCPPPTC